MTDDQENNLLELEKVLMSLPDKIKTGVRKAYREGFEAGRNKEYANLKMRECFEFSEVKKELLNDE